MDTITDPGRAVPAAPRATNSDPALLADRLRNRLDPGQRFILGLAGPPGTGKSTFAEQLAAALHPLTSVVVPLDGFHLGSAIINGTPLEHRKGAIDTFDVDGYAVLMDRLRRRGASVVYAPMYDRTIEEPIAGSIAIHPQTEVVITEGNYLLVPEGPWARARQSMDQVWFVEAEHELRVRRLIDRHIQFGKTTASAHAWVHASDEVNAAIVMGTRQGADLVVNWN